MTNITMTPFAAALRCAYYCLVTPRTLPPLLWGGPGEAKTSMMTLLAEAMDAHLETQVAAICDPTDFGGALWPDNDRVKRLPMEWAHRLANAKRGILFLDEISTAPMAVQHALLRLVLDKRAGDFHLGDNTSIAAAANPPEQAGGYDLSDPMWNRFTHVMWPGPSVDEWGEFMLTGSSAAEILPAFDRAAYDRQLPLSRALIVSFLRKRSALFREAPEKYVGRFPKAFATPRTWDAAAKLHATCTVFGDDENKARLLGGTVGEGAGIELCAYERAADLPDVEALLRKPSDWKPDPQRPDRTFAVVMMVAAAATQPQVKDGKPDVAAYSERWEAAWKVMHRTMAEGKDLVVVGARMLAKARPVGNAAILKPEVQKIISELVGVVREAGLATS